MQLIYKLKTTIPWEFQNCSDEYEFPHDHQYLACIKFLSSDADFCDYLKFVHHAFTFPYYFLGLIPLIFSIIALIINLFFTYITILIFIGNNTKANVNKYTFLLSRSICTLIAQILFYIVLIAWKSEGFGYSSATIFLFLGSLSFLTLAGTNVALSIITYTAVVHTFWHDNNMTLIKCSIINAVIWLYNLIFSIFVGLYGSTLIYPDESNIDCKFDNCQKPLAISITILLFISYFFVLFVYGIAIFKAKKNENNLKRNVTICGKRNMTMMHRLVYNILVFAIMKIPLLVICGFTLHDLENLKALGNGEETACKKFLHGKLYFKAEVLASVTIFVTLLGMIIDPLINIMFDYRIINERLQNHLFPDGSNFRFYKCFPFLSHKIKSAK